MPMQPPNGARRRLMLVDDEVPILHALKRELRHEGYEIETFSSAVEALEHARAVPPDMVISDFRMPEMDGVAFLTEMKSIRPETARIILSCDSDLALLMHAINKAEIYRFICKPWDGRELKSTIAQGLEYFGILAENRRLANEARSRNDGRSRQRQLMNQLEQESPGITHVIWDDDGSIILDDS